MEETTLDQAIDILIKLKNSGVDGKTPITTIHPDSGWMTGYSEIRLSKDHKFILIGAEDTDEQ